MLADFVHHPPADPAGTVLESEVCIGIQSRRFEPILEKAQEMDAELVPGRCAKAN